MDSQRKRTIIIRGAITAVLTAVGFAFPLVWIPAAFFAYTTYQAFPDPEPDTPESMYRPRQSTVTVDDPDWREFFFEACESPAETAFLEAMISGYGLTPDNGILVGPGIELDTQTEYKPYRLDFLVNKWLVVEVDGAAWHSSAEAIERDGIRDEFFKAKGFAVLRIPAKVVFQTPSEAVGRVRAAIARGRPPQKVVAQTPVVSVAKTFTNSMNAFGKFLEDTDDYVRKAKAMQEGLGPANKTFDTERMVVDAGLEIARKSVDLEERFASNPDMRKRCEEALAEYKALSRNERRKPAANEAPKITILPMSWPPMHPDKELATKILEEYFSIVDDRKRYFDDVRRQLANDPRLSTHLQQHLESLGCHAVWEEISVKKAPFSVDAFLREMDAKGKESSHTKPVAEG
jgi:very-short-patch-repair endonuclease